MSEATNPLAFPEVTIPAAAATSPEQAIRFLVGGLVRLGRLRADHADDVVCRVLNREKLGSTNIGRGIALPHSKSNAVDRVVKSSGAARMRSTGWACQESSPSAWSA